MASLLIFGFLLGLKHALEADHVAAVASLATRSHSFVSTLRVAAAWGIGHTAALLFFGSILLLVDASLSQRASSVLEGVVGVMLVVLGLDVLRRVRQKRIHLHVHQHDDGARHFHAHAHEEGTAHDAIKHDHAHVRGLLPRALLVGTIHGMAGTAALTLLSLHSLHSYAWAVVYLALFGVGTIAGMVAITLVISLPLRLTARHLDWASNDLEAALGVITVVLGCWIAFQSAASVVSAG